MQIKWNEIKHCDIKGREYTQITFEDDYIVRDNKPDVGEIICVKGMPVLEEQKNMNGSMWLSGKVTYHMLYQDETQENGLNVMEGTIPFQEKMNIDGLVENSRPRIRLMLEEISASIVNSRKISVRGIIEVEAQIEEENEEQISSCIEDEGVEQKIEKEIVLSLGKTCNDILRIQKEIQLPKSKSNIREIIFYYIDIRNRRIEFENDYMNLRGEANICVLYKCEEGEIDWFGTTVDFSSGINCGAVEEDEIFWPNIEELNHQLVVEQDYDGEMRQLSVELSFDVSMKIWREREVDVLKDAYSRKKLMRTEKKHIGNQRLLVKNTAKIRLAEEVKLDQLKGKILQICGCKSTSKIEYSEIVDNAVHVEGLIQTSFLYIPSLENVPVGYEKCQLPFSENIEATGISESALIDIHSHVDQVQINLLDGENYEIKAVVSVELLAMENMGFEMIAEAQLEGDNEQCNNIPGIVGYVMQHGQELWDVAKTYCTTVEEIRRDNNLEDRNPEAGERLIIVKS
ncbi:MAG: DUF3794 domain-containing protein [Agathobacter sp.]|nr:DUF3794 domain-containing protein [Agathobacter sp.]